MCALAEDLARIFTIREGTPDIALVEQYDRNGKYGLT